MSVVTLALYSEVFDLLWEGKDVDIRFGNQHIRRLRKGDRIRIVSSNRCQFGRVEEVREYQTFAEMFASEDISRIGPGYSREEIQAFFEKRLYPRSKGCNIYAIQFTLL